ncbi:hypothetical protein LOD99_497 [Oopsacas minuta]|uniref:Uncharacterized protein n=1 Tax=Oopsacas minuta TaxID=111878 RepID=A0AAV7K9D0_9METZ|nr:hypothetical protein LOD99_497 [Oopsacas minuta]
MLSLYIICLCCFLIGVQAQPPRPQIPEDFNATLGPAVFFSPILKGLDLEVFVHYNSTDPDDYPLTISDSDSLLKIPLYQIYYNLKTDYLYFVTKGSCKKIPAEDVNVAALVILPSFLSFAFVVGFNFAQNSVFVKTYEKCPYSNTTSCDLWTFQDSRLLSHMYKDDPTFYAYITRNGTPIAMGPQQDNSTLMLLFETFHKGIQNPNKFLPPNPDQCKIEFSENLMFT